MYDIGIYDLVSVHANWHVYARGTQTGLLGVQTKNQSMVVVTTYSSSSSYKVFSERSSLLIGRLGIMTSSGDEYCSPIGRKYCEIFIR